MLTKKKIFLFSESAKNTNVEVGKFAYSFKVHISEYPVATLLKPLKRFFTFFNYIIVQKIFISKRHKVRIQRV